MEKEFFHKFREKVKKQKVVIDELVNGTDEESIKLYFEEQKKLHDLLIHEESYWKQRAKAFWLSEGDLNTKFFHAQAIVRKKINHIHHLSTEAWLKIVLLRFFQGRVKCLRRLVITIGI